MISSPRINGALSPKMFLILTVSNDGNFISKMAVDEDEMGLKMAVDKDEMGLKMVVDKDKLASLKKEARRGQHQYFQIVYRL